MRQTIKFNIYEELRNEQDIKDYLATAFIEARETNDPDYITHAFGVAAKARGMLKVAKRAGVNREHLYRALSPAGNPSFRTVSAVANALGYQLTAIPFRKSA